MILRVAMILRAVTMYRFVLGVAIALASAAAPAAAATFAGYGTVSFPTSCSPDVQPGFDEVVARLHSFDWVESEALAITKTDPHCAMAFWAAAMGARGNPLANLPDADTLKQGHALIQQAQAALDEDPGATETERAYIAALDVYYRDYPGGHPARTQAYEAAMEKVYRLQPDDPEAATFYALAILEAVDLTDKTYARQLKAIAILNRVWQAHPDHPGAMHYLIHAADYAPLAQQGLAAARLYPLIATASAHAQHMPAHIYSMLGLWRDSIAANHAASNVICQGRHIDETTADTTDAHGLDFISYARLQLGEDAEVDAAVAQAPPSSERILVQARSVLERHDWPAAAMLPESSDNVLDRLTLHFTRSIAASRSGDPLTARAEASALRAERERVLSDYGTYWAGLTDVYADAADAWIAAKAGNAEDAIAKMQQSATRDDGREKHIWLENKLLPMRELYGELLLELNKPDQALTAFEASLVSGPNRLRSFTGAALAARALGKDDIARQWQTKIVELTAGIETSRPEVLEARATVAKP